MFTYKHILPVGAMVLAVAAMPGRAATPADGELNDETLVVNWDGDGPYVLPNVTPFAGDPVPVLCEPTIPGTCDQFAVTVNLSDEFRQSQEHQRENVKIAISFPADTGQEDYDLFMYDSGGALVGSSATGGQESFSVPLKTLKNGTYTVTVIPFLPLATNYSGLVQVGKGTAPTARGLGMAPQAGSAPLTVSFDARSLGEAPAGGYVFDFGDGSAPVTDADGVLEHTYGSDGQYLTQVRYGSSSKAVAYAAQPVFVGELVDAKSGANRMGGAFGLGALLVTVLGAFARRRIA